MDYSYSEYEHAGAILGNRGYVDYELVLKKKNGKWRIVNKAHKLSKVKGAVWHDIDLANMEFEWYTAYYLDMSNSKKAVNELYDDYLWILKEHKTKYYAPSSLLK